MKRKEIIYFNVSSLNEELENLITKKENIEKEIKEKTFILEFILKNGNTTPKKLPLPANPETWRDKIKVILHSKPLSCQEIIAKLIEQEPKLKKSKTKSSLHSSISGVLSTHSGDKKQFLKFKNKGGVFQYKLNPAKES